ncbi:MAG: MFS transporter [Candidatus Eisenbacteria bacterium]
MTTRRDSAPTVETSPWGQRKRLPPHTLRRNLDLIFAEGSAWSVMVGTGETYLPAFLLALGGNAVGAGLITTVPLLGGGLLQLLTPWAVRKLRSRKGWVVLCAAAQAAMFLPLLGIAFRGASPTWLVFLIATIYWGAGMAAGPAWTTWIGTIVRGRIRSRYFASRSRATQIGTATALFLAGWIVQVAERRQAELLGFVVLFTLAFLARATSTFLLVRQDERTPRVVDRAVPLRELLGRLRSRGGNRLLLVLLFMSTSVTIASPFFTPYMLRELELSYIEYVGLIGTAFLAKILALTWLGSFVARVGATRALRIGAAGILPLSALWILSGSYLYLFVLQVLSGTVWAMYEFAAFLLFFETIDEGERTSVLTLYNLGNTIAVTVGSAFGALLLSRALDGAAAYHLVFGVSSVFRTLVALVVLRLGFGRVERVAGDLRQFATGLRTFSVRPSTGGWLRPMMPTLPRRRPDQDPPPPGT